ncbi:MAG: hypothetical protein ACR2OA_15570, partial [Rubripirellula sp.]
FPRCDHHKTPHPIRIWQSSAVRSNAATQIHWPIKRASAHHHLNLLGHQNRWPGVPTAPRPAA